MTFDQSFWEDQGYVIIKNAVPPENLQAVLQDMERYTGKDLHNRTAWYDRLQEFGGGGMINMAHQQSQWDNRQAEPVHAAFAEIWGTEKLWVTLNRVNFNPPHGPNWSHAGFIHWDLDVAYLAENYGNTEACVQGVLCLTDTDETMGGFQCVPGSHRRLYDWIETHGTAKIPTVEEIQGDFPVKRLAAQAGDLILWTQALLHGNGKNTSQKPRLAQYICMTPEGTARSPRGLNRGDDELRQVRVDSWRYGDDQRLVANALGVPEGMVEQWLRKLLKEETPPDALPQATNHSKLSETQRAQLLAQIGEQQLWQRPEIVHAEAMQQKYGTTASYLPKALLAKEVAGLMEDAFGLEFVPEPAALSPLGQKLLGVESW